MSNWPAWTGTLPGWITALATGGGFVAWLKYLIDRKRLEGDRLSDLERENRELRKEFNEYRKACIADADNMQQLIAGLRRQMLQLEQRTLEGWSGLLPPKGENK